MHNYAYIYIYIYAHKIHMHVHIYIYIYIYIIRIYMLYSPVMSCICISAHNNGASSIHSTECSLALLMPRHSYSGSGHVAPLSELTPDTKGLRALLSFRSSDLNFLAESSFNK